MKTRRKKLPANQIDLYLDTSRPMGAALPEWEELPNTDNAGSFSKEAQAAGLSPGDLLIGIGPSLFGPLQEVRLLVKWIGESMVVYHRSVRDSNSNWEWPHESSRTSLHGRKWYLVKRNVDGSTLCKYSPREEVPEPDAAVEKPSLKKQSQHHE